jgi:hypothetical protein
MLCRHLHLVRKGGPKINVPYTSRLRFIISADTSSHDSASSRLLLRVTMAIIRTMRTSERYILTGCRTITARSATTLGNHCRETRVQRGWWDVWWLYVGQSPITNEMGEEMHKKAGRRRIIDAVDSGRKVIVSRAHGIHYAVEAMQQRELLHHDEWKHVNQRRRSSAFSVGKATLEWPTRWRSHA